MLMGIACYAQAAMVIIGGTVGVAVLVKGSASSWQVGVGEV